MYSDESKIIERGPNQPLLSNIGPLKQNRGQRLCKTKNGNVNSDTSEGSQCRTTFKSVRPSLKLCRIAAVLRSGSTTYYIQMHINGIYLFFRPLLKLWRVWLRKEKSKRKPMENRKFMWLTRYLCTYS